LFGKGCLWVGRLREGRPSQRTGSLKYHKNCSFPGHPQVAAAPSTRQTWSGRYVPLIAHSISTQSPPPAPESRGRINVGKLVESDGCLSLSPRWRRMPFYHDTLRFLRPAVVSLGSGQPKARVQTVGSPPLPHVDRGRVTSNLNSTAVRVRKKCL
jgi:hypothetical protein